MKKYFLIVVAVVMWKVSPTVNEIIRKFKIKI